MLAEYPRLKLTGNHNWILLDLTGEVSLISQLSSFIYPHGMSSFFWILLHPSMLVSEHCRPKNTMAPQLVQAQVLSPDTSSRFTFMRIVQVMDDKRRSSAHTAQLWI